MVFNLKGMVAKIMVGIGLVGAASGVLVSYRKQHPIVSDTAPWELVDEQKNALSLPRAA